MLRRTAIVVFALAALLMGGVQAAEGGYAGRPLREVLEEFRALGLLIVYSSDVVGPEMVVVTEPEPASTQIMLAEIVVAAGLALERRGDIFVVTPAAPTPPAASSESARPDTARTPAIAPPALENIVVHASRYEVAERSPAGFNVLGTGDIEQLVAAGREPLRAVGRLPGAAGAGLSSKQNIRGGEEDEVLVVFDGLPLFEPFHLKDFQNIFSTLDPRVVGAMEIYTGGFPAQFGDRLSGVINVVPQPPPERVRHEIGMDFFNIGVLSSGGFARGRGDWLVSARRGTLDLLFDFTNREIGNPSYYDFFGQINRRVGDNLGVSASVMYADDKLSFDETVRDTQASAEYRTLHAWLAFDQQINDELSQRTVAAFVDAENFRSGVVNRPEESFGDVRDRRRYQSVQLKQDWRFVPAEQFIARWGFDFRLVDARYRYHSSLEFFADDLLAQAVGRTGRDLDLALAPDGNQVGIYLSNRWRFAPRLSAEVGLRWDRQTYLGDKHDEQVSPRLSLLYEPNDATRLRLGWGRFSQAQGIHELQVEDGVDAFFPAQRSYHSVVGLDHRFAPDLLLRVEAYRKRMDRLRPRFENLFDGLELLPELSPDRVLVAPESATATGVELLLRHDRRQRLFGWWLGASLARVSDRIGGRDVPRSWDQRRAFNAGLNFAWGLWRVDLVGQYNSGWPTTRLHLQTIADEPGVTLGARNAARLPDFASLDLRVSRRKPLQHNRAWTLFLEVTNLTNRDNVCCVDYSLEEEESGAAFLQREFDHWLPLLPSVGFIYEF